MAVSATIIKAVATIISSDRGRKAVGWIIVLILSPIILSIIIVGGILTEGSVANELAIDYVFKDTNIEEDMPKEYIRFVKDMKRSTDGLDEAITKVNNMTESNSLDEIRVKAVFFALMYHNGAADFEQYNAFVDCFIDYQLREKSVINTDGQQILENNMIAIPITDLSKVYKNIELQLSIEASQTDIANANNVYYNIMFDGEIPNSGEENGDFINTFSLSDEPLIGLDNFCSPLDGNWRKYVTSEFGYRNDPFTGEKKYHSGIDLGADKGTPIRAVLDGTVLFVRYAMSGYGYHLGIDHGGKMMTLYAHCSQILVCTGQQVKAGDIIARVGSTGRSQGNHLHFEIRKDGIKENPRNYLP